MSEVVEAEESGEVTNVSFEEFQIEGLNYVSLIAMTFDRFGRTLRWEIANSMDYVGILLYNLDRDAFVLVRQFRPPIYRRLHLRNQLSFHAAPEASQFAASENGDPTYDSLTDTYTYEMCAGLCDKANSTLRQVAVEEVEEECGYVVSEESLHVIGHNLDVGLSGRRGTLYYCEIRDHQKESDGGGLIEEGEQLDVVEIAVDEIDEFLSLEDKRMKAGSLQYALWWWIAQNRIGKVPMTQE